MKKILIIIILKLTVGCLASDKAYYFFDEPTYTLKEKQLAINTEEAAQLFAKHYFIDHPEAQQLTASVEVLFRNKYIVSPYRLRYNVKFSRYWLSSDTYWVNGKKATVKKKKHRYVLRIARVQRADKYDLGRFYIEAFNKNFERDSILP